MLSQEYGKATFGKLDFCFEESSLPTGESRLIGFAPNGRVGIVEFLSGTSESKASLLISASKDRDVELWSALCVSTFSGALGVDLAGWVGSQLHQHGAMEHWEVSHPFGTAHVTVTFYPVDSVLVTVERQYPN